MLSGENNTTTFLPLPMELFTPFLTRDTEMGGAQAAKS
jgi:hypothetical protein